MKFACKGFEISFLTVVFQIARNFCLLRFGSAAPHGVDPLYILAGSPAAYSSCAEDYRFRYFPTNAARGAGIPCGLPWPGGRVAWRVTWPACQA